VEAIRDPQVDAMTGEGGKGGGPNASDQGGELKNGGAFVPGHCGVS